MALEIKIKEICAILHLGLKWMIDIYVDNFNDLGVQNFCDTVNDSKYLPTQKMRPFLVQLPVCRQYLVIVVLSAFSLPPKEYPSLHEKVARVPYLYRPSS